MKKNGRLFMPPNLTHGDSRTGWRTTGNPADIRQACDRFLATRDIKTSNKLKFGKK